MFIDTYLPIAMAGLTKTGDLGSAFLTASIDSDSCIVELLTSMDTYSFVPPLLTRYATNLQKEPGTFVIKS